MENGPFEDVFPIEHGDIPASYVSLLESSWFGILQLFFGRWVGISIVSLGFWGSFLKLKRWRIKIELHPGTETTSRANWLFKNIPQKNAMLFLEVWFSHSIPEKPKKAPAAQP